ncbi:MAG: ribonuclease activity regulator RraA [Alphaproteobacteria bacterium]|nr:ribonuclease activity regulator RraA [Alphaproteobacteria bacterium]
MANETLDKLVQISTATITMQLLKRGIRRCYIEGATPLTGGYERVAGPAFTIRFVPMREDVSTPASYAGSNTLREAIDATPDGAIMVADARGEGSCGTLGDILAARLVTKGAKAFVSDGAVRDAKDIIPTGLHIYSRGTVAPPSIGALHFAGYGDTIGCGGVMVVPGDIIVCDGDGAVCIPAALAGGVATDGIEQELFETFVQQRVSEGAPVTGLYPPNEDTTKAFEEWRAGR